MAAKKRRPMPPAPTLGELQKVLDKQARTIVAIEETLSMLVKNLCRESNLNMQWHQLHRDPNSKRSKLVPSKK